MLGVRTDTVKGVCSQLKAAPLGVISKKRKRSDAYNQDILRLARDVEAAMVSGEHTLFVTSARREEGKTMTAVHLAEALALLGKRVMLFDASLERSRLWREFNDIREQGKPLEKYLKGECSIKDIISYDGKKHLYLICSSQMQLQLRGEEMERLRELIQSCSKLMDYVIVDGPSMEDGGFPVLLAEICDASLLVIRRKRNSREQPERAIQELKESSAVFLGVVLNDMKETPAPVPVWGEVRNVSFRRKLSTFFRGLRKSLLRLWWVFFILVFAFCAGCFIISNHAYHPLTAQLPYNPWEGIAQAAAAAFLLWCLLLIVCGLRWRRIHSGIEVREYLGLRLLSVMPGGSIRREKTEQAYERAIGKLCAKLLCAKLLCAGKQDEPAQDRKEGGVLMVTSTVTGEGKSTLAWNMADSLAKQGKRVILLDADMHEQLMSRWLRTKKKTPIPWDLLDLMEGRAQAEGAILQMKSSGVYFIGMSREVKQPAVFMQSRAMGQLLEALRETMDYVIIDAPPASSVEAEFLAEQTDGIVYAIGRDMVPISWIQGSLQRLERGRAKLLGAVICRELFA